MKIRFLLPESNMQTKELDHASIRAANKADTSGSSTAGETNRGLRIGEEKNLRRIAFSTLIVAAGLFFSLAAIPARADEDHDRHSGGWDYDKGIRAEIAALQAQIASLQSTVSALQGEVSALQTTNAVQQNQINKLQTNNAKLQNQVTSLQTSNTRLESQLTTVQSNPALALGPFVSVDPNPEFGVIGPHIKFKGANIHIESGSEATDDHGNSTGLGNLIIGYDEDPSLFGRAPLSTGDRGGSHNLVIGSGHRFTKAALGGLLAGELNTISNLAASVSGGLDNIASGGFASVTGGASNTASDGNGISFGATAPSVSGGVNNTAGGPFASVSGGENNTASGAGASVSGGLNNTATGTFVPVQAPSVSGGENNIAIGEGASVTGGLNNTAIGNSTATGAEVNTQAPSVSGGENNTASGNGASVTGGTQNTAGGLGTVVIGGHMVTDNNNNSIAPKPPFP
jgi:trimeric autotransporter adhesin